MRHTSSHVEEKVRENTLGAFAYQFVVIHHHQLDVLGLGLVGTLTSPHLEGVKEIHEDACESGIITPFVQDKQAQQIKTVNHTEHKHTLTSQKLIFVLEESTATWRATFIISLV